MAITIRSKFVAMSFCPNCDAKVISTALACPSCNADFGAASAWKPQPRSRDMRRGRQTFWGGTAPFLYDPEEYKILMKEVSRDPLKPGVVLPLFGLLVTLAILARPFLGGFSVIVVLLLALVFPYYVVRWAMLWKMGNHLKAAIRRGGKPSYVPSNPRAWAGLYVGVFFTTGYLAMQLHKLLK